MRPHNDKLVDLDVRLYPGESVHERDIRRRFKSSLLRELSSDEINRLGEIDVFCILFTNRCGSNYLAELLKLRGMGIRGSEPFNRGAVMRTTDKHDLRSFSDYVLFLAKHWQRHNRVGFKISAEQLFWLTRLGLLNHFRSVSLVHSMRRDVVGQAVSFHIARGTGQWLSSHEEKQGRDTVRYDRQEILKCIWNIQRGRQLSNFYINVHQPPAIEVYYEDVLADPAGETQRIADFLEVAPDNLKPLQLEAVALRKQRDDLNQQLRAEFEKEFFYT